MADEIALLLDDLAAEQHELVDVLRSVTGDTWFAATPAKGWDVRDTVAHLADTDEIAVDTCTGGHRSLNQYAQSLSSPEDLTLCGVLAGRRLTGVDEHAGDPPRAATRFGRGCRTRTPPRGCEHHSYRQRRARARGR